MAFFCVFVYSFLQVQRQWANSDGGSCRITTEASRYNPAHWRLSDGRSVAEME